MLPVNGATLVSGIYGKGQGGEIVVDARDSISIGEEARIFNVLRENAVGLGGNIRFNTKTLLASDGAFIASYSFGNGSSGDIQINADSLHLTNDSFLQNSTFGSGNAGDIQINVRDYVSISQSAIQNSVGQGATGNGGNTAVCS